MVMTAPRHSTHKRQKIRATTPSAPEISPMPIILERLGMGVVIALAVIIPLLVISPDVNLPNPTDTPKRLVLLLGAGVLGALILWSWALRRSCRLRCHPLDLPAILLVLAACITGALGLYPHVSFLSPLWTQDLDAVLPLCLVVLLYFGAKEFIRNLHAAETVVLVLVLTGVVEALLAFGDYWCAQHGAWGFHPGFSGKRLVGTLGNPMYTGNYFAMLIPLGVGAALAATSSWRRWLLAGGAGILAMALLFTSTRGAYLALALSLLVMILVFFIRWRVTRMVTHPIMIGALAILCLGVLGAVMLNPQLRNRLHSIANLNDGSVQTRLVYMRGAYEMFRAHPLQGWGPGNLRLVFPAYRPSSQLREGTVPLNRGYSASLPHNLPLQIAAEMGVIGLLPFAALVIVLLWTGIAAVRGDATQIWLAWGLLGLLVANLLANLVGYDNTATLSLFWLGLALLAGLTAREAPLFTRATAPRPLPAVAARLLKTVAVLVLLSTAGLTITQATGAYALQAGIDGMNRANEAQRVSRQDEAYARIERAIADLNTALSCANNMDYNTTGALTMAYRTLVFIAPGAEAKERASADMFRMGEYTLALVDREPQIRRLLAREYTAWKRLDDAERTITRLQANEPHSAEVCLIYAEMLENAGRLAEAETQTRTATKLDPTFGDAWVQLAHLRLAQTQQQILQRDHPTDDPALADICTLFTRAETLHAQFSPALRQEYATVLFLAGRTADATVVGKSLVKTANEQEFRTNIERIGIRYQRQRDAGVLLAALGQV